MKIERCIRCDDPTGRAGRGDDSLYTDDGNGPFCPDCWGGVRSSELSASVTAPDDPIRRGTAERAIRARQRDTEDSGIYAGLSVALQELAALPADPVAEAAGKRIAELEAAVSDAMVVIADMAPGETVLIDRLRSLLAKGGA